MLKSIVKYYLVFIMSLILGIFLSRVESGSLVEIRKYIDEFYLFVKGHNEEETTFSQKILSEINQTERNDVISLDNYKSKLKKSKEFKITTDLKFILKGIIPNEASFAFHIGSKNRKDISEGYFVIIGNNDQARFVKFPHDAITDFYIDSNSIIALSNHELLHYNICGDKKKWSVSGAFHHYFTPNSDKVAALGTIMDKDLVKIEKALDKKRIYTDANHNITVVNRSNGKLIRSFDFYDIAKANIDRFDPLIIEKASQNRRKVKEGVYVNKRDYWHPNDLELFPNNLESRYFDNNDILVSAKGYNLLFVVSIDTLKIKWFSQGWLQGQHDADWLTGDSFTVFNNRSERNPSSKFSSIEKFNFADSEYTILVNGSKFDAITRHSGGHSIFKDIASMSISIQGRHILTNLNNDNLLAEIFLYNKNSLKNVKEGKLISNEIYKKTLKCKNWQFIK